VSAALAMITAGVDALQAAMLSSVSSLGLTDSLREGETAARRLASGMRAVLGEADRRGIAAELCAASTADVLRQLTNIDPRQASARVRGARSWTPRVAVSGEGLPPLFSRVAVALDAGQITVAHARIISQARESLPGAIDALHGDAVEAFLVDQAPVLTSKELRGVARRLLDTLNPDGALNDEADQERRRDFHLIDNADGSSTPAGRFTPELTAFLKPILDSLSAPQPAGDDLPDIRTPGQRRHDCIIEAAALLYRSNTLPDAGGVPVSITVTVTDRDLQRGRAGETVIVEDSYGTPLKLSTLAALSSEIQLGTVTLSTAGGILDYGRTRRLASCAQRRALAARDKGCAFTGCTRHASWCEVHHVVPWLHGGETNLSNMVLLCRFHHRNFERAGWQIQMGKDHVPECIPPAWLDPDQRPRRNAAHDRPALPAFE